MSHGPKGQHSSLDSYDSSSPPKAPAGVSGYLIPPPKVINPADKKIGPRKGSPGQNDPGTFCE